MSGNVQLPDHYKPRTISSMGPDEIVHVPSNAFSADYLTRNLYVNSRFALRQVEHDQVDPTGVLDDYYTQQKIERHIGLMSMFMANGPLYVADLRALDMNEIGWSEIEETSREPDAESYPYPGLDMIDYNQYVKANGFYRPISAAAVIGASGDVEFQGEGQALDAVNYLVEEMDYLKEALANYIETNRNNYSYGYDTHEDVEDDEQDKASDSMQIEYNIFDDI